MDMRVRDLILLFVAVVVVALVIGYLGLLLS
jgi:hypothetical protein